MKIAKLKSVKRVKLFSSFLILLILFATGTFSTAQAQQDGSRKVSGTITDKKSGEGLIGASVLVIGTTVGTITDLDGNFSVMLPAGKNKLSFNYIGYKKMELEAPESGPMKVGMEDNSVEMNEVVVVGYGTVKKSDLTGSITTVSTKDMKNTSILSADQAMQGRATGVMVVNNSGAPGSPVSIKIRGVSSFGNTDPLYVVDGMPIKDSSFGKDDNPSGINFLNPNDIESIQVLKDASAAAIYGTRGANGVILITTKRGKSGKMRVDVENYMGVQSLKRNVDVLNSQQFADLRSAIGFKDSLDVSSTTNWVDQISREAIVYNNQVSISGGANESTYFVSLNNYNQEGVIKKSGYTRQSLRVNLDNKVNSWLKTGVNLTIMQSDRARQTEGANGVISQALGADPTMSVYDNTGNWSYLSRTGGNPVGSLERNNYNYNTKRIQGSIFAEIELLKNLKYKMSAGLDRSTAKKSDFQPAYQVGDAKLENNELHEGHDSWDNYLLENTLTYTLTKGKHKLDLLAGYTTQFERKESYTMSANLPTSDPDLRYYSNVKLLSDITKLGGDAQEWSLLSQLGRFNYSYGEDSKYLVTASIRRDGSSRFGANKKYGVFPSWSAAWKISSEPFFKSVDLLSSIDLMKLRFGYGKVGNQNIAAYGYLGSVSNQPDLGRDALRTDLGLPKTAVPYYVDKTVSNPNLGWETSVSKNLGLDLSFWSNKLTMTVDVYDKLTTDLLMVKPLPAYFSRIDGLFGNTYQNLGTLSNKGYEFSLSYKKYEGELNFEITGNLSKNFNKMVALNGGQTIATGYSIVKEGMPLGTFFGYKYDGIFQNQEEVDNHAFQTTGTAPGDFKFKDINRDGKIDEADQTALGGAFPSFVYGFTLNMSYKGFDLNVFTQGVQGNKIVNQMRQMVLYNYNVNTNVSPDLLNYWTPTNTNTNIPRLASAVNENNRFSDYYLEDGSYFRVKTITLGYTLKKEWAERIKLTNLRVYVTIQNPLTFTKYTGFDPEIGQSNGWNSSSLDFGVDGGAYPQARMMMGGLSLSF